MAAGSEVKGDRARLFLLLRPLAVCLLVVLAGGPSVMGASEPKTITVRGAITDETGSAVPGHPVRLLKSRKILSLGGFTSTEQSVEEVRVTTDAHGFFEFQFPSDGSFPYYYLRFYDPDTFDAVKYRLPADRDVSRAVRKGKTVQVAVILELDKRWPEVKALLDQVGPGSQVGQVLRALGLPTGREARGGGRELWTYGSAGVAYLVEGAKVLETRRVPVTGAGAPTSAPVAGGGEDEPVKATRVDEP